MVFIGRKGLREAFTFELTKFKLQRNTVNRGTSSVPKAKLRKKRMRHTVGHNMRNRKRHETVLDRFAKAFGNSPRIATHRVMDSVDEKEREASLPMFLFRVRIGEHPRPNENRYDVMVKTWNEALRKYTNSNSAMADWLFAWEIDSTSNLAQFLMSMKKNQAMLLTQAQLGIEAAAPYQRCFHTRTMALIYCLQFCSSAQVVFWRAI